MNVGGDFKRLWFVYRIFSFFIYCCLSKNFNILIFIFIFIFIQRIIFFEKIRCSIQDV
uniref:Uncharacterized protein n=1 Tax=Meloidogyne enterolobii TaxID=390850 RepID=A0A6V7VM51_MELEN|nr:unnamed protein product [Meloidogyne enterolobii]